ncbi:MAG: hypothetical protein JWN93_2430 [Hyphomicrobiales bacterium]|nr:hypothetical protein [Hyphomicrobiales bacterium]
MPFSATVKKLVANAWDEGYVCLLATEGPDGPNVSPKGSMMIFDDDHLAYWERAKKTALVNLRANPRVVVVYSNMAAQRDGRLESGVLRFHGEAELHEDGAIRDAIFARLNEREATHDGADAGIGVLIRLTKAEDVRGKPLR